MAARAVVVTVGRGEHNDRWMRQAAIFCQRHNLTIVALAADPGTALHLLADNGADTIVCAHANVMWPHVMPVDTHDRPRVRLPDQETVELPTVRQRPRVLPRPGDAGSGRA